MKIENNKPFCNYFHTSCTKIGKKTIKKFSIQPEDSFKVKTLKILSIFIAIISLSVIAIPTLSLSLILPIYCLYTGYNDVSRKTSSKAKKNSKRISDFTKNKLSQKHPVRIEINPSSQTQNIVIPSTSQRTPPLATMTCSEFLFNKYTTRQ